MMKQKSKCVSLCGMMCALAIVMLTSGSIMPLATFCAPAIAGMMLLPIAVDYGTRPALVCYGATSALSVLLVPDKEIAALFVFFLGYYPVLKAYLEKLRFKVLRLLAKLLVFNVAIVSMYWVLLHLFAMQQLVQEFAEMGQSFNLILLLLGNVCFLLYDVLLQKILLIYVYKIRPKFIR